MISKFIALCLPLCLVAFPLAAETRTWTGGGGDDLWSTDANWNSNAPPEAGSELFFPDTAARKTPINDLPAGMAFARIAVEGGSYIIDGNPVTLTNGISASSSQGTNVEVKLGVVLAADQVFRSFSANLKISGAVDLNGHVLNLDMPPPGPSTLELAGAISGSPGSGLKLMSGVLTFIQNLPDLPVTVNNGGEFRLLSPGVVGQVTLNGGLLSGTGRVERVISGEFGSGVISPGGVSPGTLTVSGDVGIDGGPHSLAYRIRSLNQPTANLLQVNGDMNIAGAQLTLTGNNAHPAGTRITILQAAGKLTGTFSQGNFASTGIRNYSVVYHPNRVEIVALGPPTLALHSHNVVPVIDDGEAMLLVSVVATGTPGKAHYLQISGDLSGWEDVASATASTGGVLFLSKTMQPQTPLFLRVRNDPAP